MKKIVLISSLLASSFGFGADWVFVAESQNYDNDYYVDVDSFNYNKQSNKARVWYKRNVFSGLNEYTDTKTFVEYDCINRTEKYLSQSTYNIDGFALTNVNTSSKQIDIIPDTVGSSLWEVACKNKGTIFTPYKPNFIDKKRIELLEIGSTEKAP